MDMYANVYISVHIYLSKMFANTTLYTFQVNAQFNTTTSGGTIND